MTDMLLHFYKALMGFGLAAAIVWVLTPAVSELARRMGVMDEPEARKIHAYPTPRLGGIALFVGVIVPALLLLSSEPANRGILLGAALVVVVGALDDFRDTPPMFKFAGQLVAASILVYFGVMVETLSIPCLLYTSDAADDLTRVDLGGRRIIKKKKKKKIKKK